MGNTLSAALRDAWDGTSIKPATKTHACIRQQTAHQSLLGHITPAEMLDLMKARELSNDFANRFIMIWAKIKPRLSIPSPDTRPPARKWRLWQIARQFVLRFAQADRLSIAITHGCSTSQKLVSVTAPLYRDALQETAQIATAWRDF